MKIFKQELIEKHHASLVGVLKRHKAGVGYVILCLGIIAAFLSVVKVQNEFRHQEEVKSGIICQNLSRTDRQTLVNLHSKVDRELIKNLNLTKQDVEESIRKQLKLSAEQRKSLQPSAPPKACSSAITTLPNERSNQKAIQ